MIEIIKESYTGGKITREINKTEMPDECILFIMRNEGYPIKSIDELAEVTQEWTYDHDNKILKLSTKPVYKLMHTRVTIEVNTKPEVGMRHTWAKTNNGEVEEFQVGEEDYHTGPICSICGFSFCIHCNEDGWNDNTCHVPKITGTDSISGPKVDLSDFGIDKKDIAPIPLEKWKIGPLKKMAVTTRGFESIEN